MTYIRKSKLEDILHVSKNMRDADREEVKAASNQTPLDALTNGFELSKPSCFSVVRQESDGTKVMQMAGRAVMDIRSYSFFGEKVEEDDTDIPIAMFGVAPVQDRKEWGSIWMLGTDDITDLVPISFLRCCKRFLPTFLSPYEMVFNLVDHRNTVHIKWLKWMGFSIIREVSYSPSNNKFYEFARLNHVYSSCRRDGCDFHSGSRNICDGRFGRCQ